MAVTVYRPSYISSRRVLLIGLAVLLTCVGAALVAAFGEYLATGGKEFFALRDVMHHETFEVTIIAFGIGVFVTPILGQIRILKPVTSLILAYENQVLNTFEPETKPREPSGNPR